MVHLKSFVNGLVSLLPALVPKSELDPLGLNYLIGKSVWSCPAGVVGNLVIVFRKQVQRLFPKC